MAWRHLQKTGAAAHGLKLRQALAVAAAHPSSVDIMKQYRRVDLRTFVITLDIVMVTSRFTILRAGRLVEGR
jgi:hypothetical protein